MDGGQLTGDHYRRDRDDRIDLQGQVRGRDRRSSRLRHDPPGHQRRTSVCARRSQELKERLKVLERITVDKENSLSREIESLRDR